MNTRRVHTLVIGSGAAGLCAAVRLHALGVTDVLICSEGLRMGTSINTGSDKQTYYKLGLCGEDADSPVRMAQTYFDAGATHGDIALAESALSARCFSHLCDIGVPFPHDAYGQYAGYKTDHDPLRRATSVGPYTSREMCLRLIDECRMRGVRFAEGFVAVRLLTAKADESARPDMPGRPLRCLGALAIDINHKSQLPDLKSQISNLKSQISNFKSQISNFKSQISNLKSQISDNDSQISDFVSGCLCEFHARDTIFAVGGPGGLYGRSVYPAGHTGGIGLALAAGARARNLPLSQFGLASVKFRWNVSGTYMQVLPRFISTAADGVSDASDFLLPVFGGDAAAMASAIFLKGYQWPFDAEKAENGSSRIDLAVREETIVRGRRVFLDFRTESPGLDLSRLSPEAHAYLANSNALDGPPIARLERMNPAAIALYREHNIDIANEPLEIALCAQHNNGGLAADAWWQSENVAHLWPIGEVNGSHGIRRPGGSALNAGQVGAYRAAEAIAATRRTDAATHHAAVRTGRICGSPPHALSALLRGTRDWRTERHAIQTRMDEAAGPVRSAAVLERAAAEARAQLSAIRRDGFAIPASAPAAALAAAEALRTESLCLASIAYLEACLAEVRAGAGSRGSSIVLDTDAAARPGVSPSLVPENPAFRSMVQETEPTQPDGESESCAMFAHRFTPVRPIPCPDDWFENVWRDYREGRIFQNNAKLP